MDRRVVSSTRVDDADEKVCKPVRDPGRRNGRRESKAFERLQAELARCFAASDSAYQPLDAETVIRRNRPRATA